MKKKVAQKATLLYFSWANKNKEKKVLIRFFGGEPLMDFELLEYLVKFAKDRARQSGLEVSFDLTTNGLLLDADKIDFFNKNKEVNVVVSLDGDNKTQNLNRNMKGAKADSYKNIYGLKDKLIDLPNVTVNMVAAPNQVKFFYENFLHNYDLGFKKFNFLPAYFMKWKDGDLKSLIGEFTKILHFLRKHDDVAVKNMEVFSDVPFFNSGFVVDCSGDLYGTNIILSRHFMHLSGDLVEGNVLEDDRNDLLNFDKNSDIVSLIKENIEGDILYSTFKVDKILTNFVKKLLIPKGENYGNKEN